MALILIAVGAVVSLAGTALYSPRAAIILAGVLLVLAGVDLERPDRGER